MTERVLGPTGSPRRRWTLLLPLAMVALLAALYIPSAVAVHDLNLFQLDRNAVDPSTAGDDWNTPPKPTGSAGDFTGILDDIGNANPVGGGQFQAGGSKDDLDITQWLWKAGEPLDKDDITNAYAAAYTNTVDTGSNNVGDLIIYFGLDRFSTDGSAQVGFWFLQDPNFGTSNVAQGGGFKFSGQHQDNDVLVQSNFSNGGVISTITVYKWIGGALQQVAQLGDCVGGSGDDAGCATVNQAGTTAPWSYTPKSGPSGTFPTSAFFEGGLNISRLIPGAGCFSEFLAETRSSTPFDSRLKDFVEGDLDTCVRDVRVTKEPDAGDAGSSVNAGSNISFSIKVENLGNVPATNVTLSDTLPDTNLTWSETTDPANACTVSAPAPPALQTLSCNFGTLAVGAAGDRTVTISSPTTTASCGVKPNTVTVSATGDIDTSNNSDTGQITVNCGAMRILKKSTKTGNPLVTDGGSGALFSITGAASFTVRDNNDGTPAGSKNDDDTTFGEVCVSGLAPGSYTVNESGAPTGYGGASETNVSYTVVAGSTCANATEITFTNPPLGEVVVDYNDLGSTETKAKIDCNKGTQSPADATPSAFDDNVETYTSIPAGTTATPNVVTCTISIDP